MSFFFKKEEMKISPYEKEKKIEQVMSMFPLLSRDHFLYSTLERNNWSLDVSIPSLQRRHEYLENEQYQIERKLKEQRLKKEQEAREREREERQIAQLREIFGSKFTHHQYTRALYDNRYNVEQTINHFMREIDYQADRDRRERQKRLDDEDRLQRQRDREEFERQERNKKRVNDLLLEIKYSTPEQKRELAQTKLFKDVIRDFDRLLEPEIKTIYVPVPQPSPPQQLQYPPNHFQSYPQHSSPPPPLYPQTFNYIKPSPPTTTTTTTSNQPPTFQSLDPFSNKLNPFFDGTPSSTTMVAVKPDPVINPALVKDLKLMFPNSTEEIIRYVLLSCDCNASLAVQTLLDISIKVEKNRNM